MVVKRDNNMRRRFLTVLAIVFVLSISISTLVRFELSKYRREDTRVMANVPLSKQELFNNYIDSVTNSRVKGAAGGTRYVNVLAPCDVEEKLGTAHEKGWATVKNPVVSNKPFVETTLTYHVYSNKDAVFVCRKVAGIDNTTIDRIKFGDEEMTSNTWSGSIQVPIENKRK